MDKVQRELIRIVKASLNNEKIDYNPKVEWKALLKEARDHQLVSLVNHGLNKNELREALEPKALDKLKMKIIRSNIRESKHIYNVEKVLKELQRRDIRVIVLKGLVLRNFYEVPELRTMSDADILVPLEDLDRVAETMVNLGYKQSKQVEDHGAHIVFKKPGEYPVEVHWTLINDAFFKGSKGFEESLWHNCMEVTLGKIKAKSLSLENLGVHLCTHMAVHLAYMGFGLRQIIDFTLFVNKYGNEINWNEFLEKINGCGIQQFVYTVFQLCNKVFEIKIPKEIQGMKGVTNKYTNLLLEDILKSGTHGKKDKARVFASEFAFEQGAGASGDEKVILHKWFRLLFPPIGEMGESYSYAKTNKILAPIAYIHHLLSGVFNKKYSFYHKYKIATSTLRVAKKRNKLLKALNL